MEVEQTGHQIIAALTQNDAGMQNGMSANEHEHRDAAWNEHEHGNAS